MIKLVRLDYRLLHGQVVFSWTGHVGAQRIIVVDDDAANDEMKKSALLLSKPAGVRVNIFTVDKAIAKMPKVEQLDEKIMMIFGNTAALLKFCQAYPKIKEINYGAVANKPGSVAFDQSVFLTPEEQADTQKLLDMGVKIYSQQTPTFKVVPSITSDRKEIRRRNCPMFVTALLLGLVGVFCILDSRILGRMNFERPLITCTIVGALLGDLQTGLTLGASIELMSLGIVNIGAAAPPDMNMAAIICAAFAILTDASAETALALAIPIAVLGQMLGVLMRTILSNLTHVADHAIAEGKFRKAWSMHIVWGTLLYSLMYFIPIFLSVYFGTDLVQKIVAFIPAWLTDGLNLGSKFLTAYGIALLLSTMLNRDLTVYFLLGFFFVGYLGLDITAVAIFAAILAVILTGLKYGKGAPAAAAAGAAAANPDYDPLEDDDDL